ncbi:MAG: ribosome-associated translation inhibitor RaiA [Proteobacteria bacterium]|nr:MAG: ribosome-associated translation inhibitor RaiA [Pseudomonadota bacterium]
MNVMHYFRHMDSSDALKYEVEQRLSGLEPLIQTSTPIHVTFSVGGDRYTVHVGLHARNNSHVEVEEKSDDMHKSIDMAFESLKRVVTREKEKQVHHHEKRDPFAMQAQAAAVVTNEIEEQEYVDAEQILKQVQATGH